MLEPDEVISILQSLFKGGGLRRVPGNNEDAAIVMALAVSKLDEDGYFEESEIDAHLSSWLARIVTKDSSADHMTLRRHLVDFGFLRRSSDGVIYRVSPERILSVLSRTSLDVDPEQVLANVKAARNKSGADDAKVTAEKTRRKQLKRNYKDTPKEQGVYRIRNTANGKSYISSSKDVRARLNRHRMELKTGTESVRALLNDWTEHGDAVFEFEIVDLLEPLQQPGYDSAEDLEVLEGMWLEKLQPYEPEGYNPR